MDHTKEQFLQILGDYINSQKTEITDCDDEALCRYANLHQLGSIVYFQIKNVSLSKSFSLAISSYVNKERICGELINLMRENGIDSFRIKGSMIASFYHHPPLRTSGDSDIVVSDLKTAHKVLMENDYKCISRDLGREWKYENGFLFEIHDRLVFNEAINEDKITNFLNGYSLFLKDGTLDINFHFVYIIAHLRKHLMNSGVGFRQFMDVAMIVKNCKELDWVWIEKTLEKIGLLTFMRNVLAFIERWWRIIPPIKVLAISDDFFYSATDYIFQNGVFGFNNHDNDNYLAANEMRNRSRLVGTLRSVFPSYDSLCACEEYGFLRGKHKIALPCVWLYRICRGFIRGNIKYKFNKVVGNFVPTKYIEQREEMFRQWGLSD